MHRDADVFGAAAVLHGQHHFAEQIGHVRADHVAAEDLVGVLVHDELHEALCLAHRARLAIRAEREFAHAIGTAARFHFLLGESHGGQLRPRIHDVRNRAVVHVHRLPGDHFGGDHTLLLRLVCKQLTTAHVADRVHVRQIGLLLIVHQNFAARPHREPKRRRVDAAGSRLAAYRDQHVVGLEVRDDSVFLDMHSYAVVVQFSAGDFCAGVDLEPLLAEDLVGFFHQIIIVAGENRGQELDHRDLGPQSAPHGAELEPDHAAADDHQMLGDFRNRQRAHIRQHALLVEFQEGQLHRHRTRGDDHRLAVPM